MNFFGEYKYFDRDSGGFLTPLKGKLYKGFSKFTGRYVARFRNSQRVYRCDGRKMEMPEKVELDGKKMRITDWGETLNGVYHGRRHLWDTYYYQSDNFKHGECHGINWVIGPEGLKEIDTYKNGVRHGLHRIFYDYLKTIRIEKIWNNGKLEEDKYFDLDGNPCDSKAAFDRNYLVDVLGDTWWAVDREKLINWKQIKCRMIKQNNLEDYELEIPEGYDTTGFALDK